VSQDWPEGHICFPVYRDIGSLIADPDEAAAWQELMVGELASGYRYATALMKALSESPEPGSETLSKAKRLVALKELVTAVAASLDRQGLAGAFSGAQIAEAYRQNAGDAAMDGDRESRAAFLVEFLVRQRGLALPVPPARRLHVEPVLADHVSDLADLVRQTDLAGELGQLKDDLRDRDPGAAEKLREAGGLLADRLRELVTAERPLGQAQLTLRLAADSDIVPASLGPGLAQVIANALSKRVVVDYGEPIGPMVICPE
jgi:hypothetical protein